MYAETARLYDLINEAQGRDVEAEADRVVAELRRRRPDARTLLDVACGTGAQLPRFAETCEVTGVDLSGDMLAVAAARCPGLSLVRADMRDFHLDRRYDAVVCLFSGIGYLTEEADLRRAVATMAEHLAPGGVLMIEGWIEPESWRGAVVNADCGRGDGVAVARVVRSDREGMHCDLHMRYVIAAAGEITTIDEHHAMRLSDPDEFRAAYEAAGLEFERLPDMLHPGRAVYVGERQ